MSNKRISFAKAIAGFTPDTIKAAAVEGFLRNAPGARQPFEAALARTRPQPAAGPGELESCLQALEQCDLGMGLDTIEAIFEALLSDGHIKNLGAVYTPAPIRDFIIQESLRNCGPLAPGALPTVLDPACGSAGFLISAAGILHRTCGLPYDLIFGRCLLGVDVCQEAVDNARCICSLFLAQHGIDPGTVGLQIFQADSLLTAPADLLARIGQPQGVDVVCTNPPYVKLQNLAGPYREALIAKYSTFVKGSFSLAPLFLVQGIELLKPSGCLGFITQNNFPTSLSGEPVRRYLQHHGYLSRYIDFGHQQIFQDASAYTCLMFAGRARRTHFEFSAHQGVPTAATLAALASSRVPFASLSPGKWRIGETDHLRQLDKIEKLGTPLGALTAIRVGFATLKDEVFLIRPGHPARIEPELLKPAIKITEFTAEAEFAGNRLAVLFPYRKAGARYELIPETELADRYPRAYRHLCLHREALESRDRGRKHYPGWYAWARTQAMAAPGPKLLTKAFSQGPRFMLDPSDALFCNGYSISPGGGSRSPASAGDLAVIQRILNSKIMRYYTKLTSFQLGGNYQCFQKNFIEKFGMPELGEDLAQAAGSLVGDAFDRCLAEDYYGLDWTTLKDYLDQN